MQPVDDNTLMRQYAETGSDEAFTVLVSRHINLVYSVAMRQVGDPHQAEEIAQVVFIILARKAASLRHEKALSSWLFQTTRLTANNSIRSEMRRHRREQEAYMQSPQNESPDAAWQQIGPELDAAVAALGTQDRRAILLRFYEGRGLREIGAALGASEDAAEKRVSRALEKLRKFFAKRGVSSTTAIIAGVISANSVQAAPVGLAKTISAVAVATGTAASGSTLTLVKGALKIMAWSKTKTTIVGVTIALLGIGTATVAVDALLPVPDIQGAWECTANEPGGGVHSSDVPKERLVLRIAKVNGAYQVIFDNIDKGVQGLRLDRFAYNYPTMHGGSVTYIGTNKDDFSFVGRVNRFGDTMTWKCSEMQFAFSLVFRRTTHPTPFPEPLTDAEFAPRAGSALQGFWVGMIGKGKGALHIQIKIAEASDGTYRAEFYDLDQLTNGFPTAVSYDGSTVKLMPTLGAGMFEGWLRNGSKEMVGNWIQNDYRTATTLTQENYSDFEARAAK